MITKENLIEKLIDGEDMTPYQLGYNSAIISILKLINEAEPSMETRLRNAMISEGADSYYRIMTSIQIAEILEAVKSCSKFQAIKLLKEFTGMGLKEAKDVIDRIY